MRARGGTGAGVGSVVEITMAGGYMYALCIYEDPSYGSLWRIVDRSVDARPDDLASFVRQPERFFAFSPIEAVVGDAPFKRVGQVALASELKTLPTLRWPIHRPGSNEILRWKLWSGSTKGTLPLAGPEHSDLSILQVTHPNTLRERLDAGWRPRDHPVTASPSTDPTTTTTGAARFFLDFPDQPFAEKALRRLRNGGWTAEAQEREGRVTVVASRPTVGSPAAFRDELEQLAREFGGEYGGWEVEIVPSQESESRVTRPN